MRCRLTDKTRGGGDNVHSPPDLSLPDVTARVTPRTDSLLLFLSIPLLYIHSLSIPSLYLCSSSKKKKEGSPPPIVWALSVVSDPSLNLSLSPLSSSLLLSSPCCDRAHLLDLGYTRSESNYLAATSVSSPRLDFWESISPLLSLP